MNNPLSPTTPVAEYRMVESADTETINATRNLIERKGRDLAKLKEKKRLIKEKEQSLLDNNQELLEAESAAQEYLDKILVIKKQIKESPESARIRILKREISDEEKELEGALSTHLVNYHNLTGSAVFDTTDGREIPFKTSGKFSSKALSSFLEEGEDE